MKTMQKRRDEWLQKIYSPAEREGVFAYLKSLMGIPPDGKLPNGTPIITEIIRREDALAEHAES